MVLDQEREKGNWVPREVGFWDTSPTHWNAERCLYFDLKSSFANNFPPTLPGMQAPILFLFLFLRERGGSVDVSDGSLQRKITRLLRAVKELFGHNMGRKWKRKHTVSGWVLQIT